MRLFCVCALPQGELRISVLPTYLSYDAPWPVRKIPLRCTVHYVSYHVESKARLFSLSPHSTKGAETSTHIWGETHSLDSNTSTRITRCKIKAYWSRRWKASGLEVFLTGKEKKSMQGDFEGIKSLMWTFFLVGFCIFSFQVYAVCTSVKEPCTRIPRMTGEEKEYEVIERGQCFGDRL